MSHQYSAGLINKIRIKKYRFITINYENSCAFLIFLMIFMDVPYIKHISGGAELFRSIYQTGLLCFLILWKYEKNFRVSTQFFIFTGFLIIVLISTVLSGSSLGLCLRRLFPICIIVMYIYKNDNKIKLASALRVWMFCLKLLLIIDLVSILLFPNGLYQTSLYETNWFLGYKTERLVYTLPLLIISAYLLVKENKKVNVRFVIISLLAVTDVYLTNATAAFVGMSFFLIILLLITNPYINLNAVRKGKTPLVYKLFNDKLMLIVYILIFIILVVLENSVFFTSIATTYLSKTSTLSGRTFIWSNCLIELMKSPWLGIGSKTSAEYAIITGMKAGTNAHNFILSLLLSGGGIGTAIYLWFHTSVLKRVENTPENMILIGGIFSILLVGLTSSSFLYAPLFYCLYFLIL